MQINAQEKEYFEHFCGLYVMRAEVPDLVYETSLPISGGPTEMLTFLEEADDSAWVRFFQELTSAAVQRGRRGLPDIVSVFKGADVTPKQVWESICGYAPQVEASEACFGLALPDSGHPIFHLSDGYVQRTADGTDNVLLFKKDGSSWKVQQVPKGSSVLYANLLTVLLRNACTFIGDGRALSLLRQFFMSAWQNRRDKAKALLQEMQFIAAGGDDEISLFRQLPVFSFGENESLKRNYRVRRVYPSLDLSRSASVLLECMKDEMAGSSKLVFASDLEDVAVCDGDSICQHRPFLELVERIMRDEGLEQVLLSLVRGITPSLLTHERFIEPS
jgi:hypothetical protein